MYFTSKSTNEYISVLSQLLMSYNSSKHSSIGMSPKEVTTENQKEVWTKLYGGTYPTSNNFRFQVGDQVRVSRIKGKFEQGYLQNWSEEVFVVVRCIGRSPPVYRLKDCSGEDVEGSFYVEELQKVYKADDAYFKIEKVIKSKKVKGKTSYFVKYKGYPEKFNAWVAASSLKKI